MEENKQHSEANQAPPDDELKQNVEGEYSLEELDRRVPSLPHEKSDDAWA
ncbi:hypothetical protein [Tumebacillus avium]|nr:hypothetical protein [Tumebacillus avium]